MAIQAKIGFVGLGIMGVGMAQNLVKLGHSLTVWNRDVSKSEKFSGANPGKVTVVATPKAVVQSCDYTFTMLSDLVASQAVYDGPDGLLAGISSGKTLIDCATLTPERMVEAQAAVLASGGHFIEAPVSGSKKPAEDGTLIFLCAGDKEQYDKLAAEFDVMGKAKFWFGDAVGQGSRAKLVVNVTMGSMLASLAEGLELTEKSGLDRQTLVDVLCLGACANPMFKGKGPGMVAGNYPTNFPLKHAQKDMRFAIGVAKDLGVRMPVAEAANTQFVKAKDELNLGDADFSAVYEAAKK